MMHDDFIENEVKELLIYLCENVEKNLLIDDGKEKITAAEVAAVNGNIENDSDSQYEDVTDDECEEEYYDDDDDDDDDENYEDIDDDDDENYEDIEDNEEEKASESKLEAIKNAKVEVKQVFEIKNEQVLKNENIRKV